MKHFLIVSLTIFVTKVFAAFGPIVSTTTGQIEGTIEKSFFRRDFFSFRGIPFAEPPIGELRFRVSF